MKNHKSLQLREPIMTPINALLELTLGDSYSAYETFQDALPDFEIEQKWQWYTPYKAWLARGEHSWTTSRGTRKEKNLFWLGVFEDYFSVEIWFKEKNRMEVSKADVSEKTAQLILNTETFGRVPTFPVKFKITTAEPLADIYTLIECKKKLER